MSKAPFIHVRDFAQFTTFTGERDHYKVTTMDHPEFGRWNIKSADLDFVQVTEHVAVLDQPVNVGVDDFDMGDQVHHCMCIGSEMETRFHDRGFVAGLQPGGYHFLTVQSGGYQLELKDSFHNVHLQLSREYYSSLLSDSERWSSRLKDCIHKDEVCYPGNFSITPAMTRTVSEIFNSPLSGSLKKLIIEAKILELIALQWDKSIAPAVTRSSAKDVMHDVRSYLGETYLEAHSLKSICLKFGINEFALKRGFRATFDSTVFEYLLSCRLSHARDLLHNSAFSILEVASIVGYKYPNHFSTAFKKKFGISPASLVRRA